MTSSGVSRQKSSSDAASNVFDATEALARVDGDIELMSSLVDIFLTESRTMMETLRTAVGSGSAGKVEKAAHRLKGSVSIFGAKMVSDAAFELEKMGREGNVALAAKTFAQLEQQMSNLQSALKQFHRTLQSSS